MDYIERTLEAERVALLNGEERGDVIAWLTVMGTIDNDWDDD